MKTKITIIFLLLTHYLLAQNIPVKKQNHSLNKALLSLKKDTTLSNAAISFLAVDLKTGETLAELNPDMAMMPASTQKLFTTAAVLELLGTSYRFRTQIQYTGTIDKSTKTLNGNIIIKGSGDPTIGSKYFYKNKQFQFINEIITSIKNAGIHKINGNIIADASIYSDEIASPKWLWEEVGNYYAIAACGLSLHDNLYQIHFKSPPQANKPTQIVKIYPEIPGLKIENKVLSSNIRSDEAYIFGAPYSYKRIIRGTIPKNKQNFIIKGAIPDPPYYFAWLLKNSLDSAGIICSGKATNTRLIQQNGKTLTAPRFKIKTLYSPTVLDIIDITNHKSNNFYAEHLLNLTAVAQNSKNISQTKAAEKLINFWQNKGMNTNGLHIVDGSGLSRLNLISAKQMIYLLKYMFQKSKYKDAFLSSLPVAAQSGTLKYFGKGTILAGNMRAKSGSIERVRAFAGYIHTKSGRETAFSVNIANYNCSSKAVKQKIKNLLTALANMTI